MYLRRRMTARSRVHSNRGGEYNGLKKYLDEEGILLETSAGYCPESNGIAERYNRTINEKVRSMLSRACLPDELWAEAASYANYIRERVPTLTPDGVRMSPYERRTGNSPDLHRMKIFGYKAISHVPRKTRGKLDDRARFGIFVGIEEYDTCKIHYPETKDVEIVRNVQFDETVFLGEEGGSSSDGGRDDSDDDYADLPG
jgi:hypothetical protein